MKISRIFEIAASILFLTAATLPAQMSQQGSAPSNQKNYGIQERGTTSSMETTSTATTTKGAEKATVAKGTKGKVGPNGECICPPKKAKKAGTRGVTGVTHKKHRQVMHKKAAAAPAVQSETRGFSGQCPADSSYSGSRGYEQPISQQPVQQQPMEQQQMQQPIQQPSTRGYEEQTYSDQNLSTRGISSTCESNVSARGVEPVKYKNHWFQFWRPKAPATVSSRETVTTTRGVEKTRNHWFQFWRPKATTSESSSYSSSSTMTRGAEEQPVQPAKKHHLFRHQKKQCAPGMAPSETPAASYEQPVEQPSTRAVAPAERNYQESCPSGGTVQPGAVQSRAPKSQDYGTRGGPGLDNPRENRYYPEEPSLRSGMKGHTRGANAPANQMKKPAPAAPQEQMNY